MKTILVLNGPNLNLLGQRQPDIYGHATLEDVEQLCAMHCQQHGFGLQCMQSNHEGQLLDWLHQAHQDYVAGKLAAVLLNAGAFTHTSVALYDAIKGIDAPVYEIHISNTHQRENFRHHSYISPVAQGVIMGFGINSYALGIEAVALAQPKLQA